MRGAIRRVAGAVRSAVGRRSTRRAASASASRTSGS